MRFSTTSPPPPPDPTVTRAIAEALVLSPRALTALGERSVAISLDLFATRREVSRAATVCGFSRHEAAELAIVASELGANVIRHGDGGFLRWYRVDHAGHGAGLLLSARDFGPPFYDFDMALRDGHDDRGVIGADMLLRREGLGVGLGTAKRMTHIVQHQPLPCGKWVHALRYLHAPQ